MSDKSYLDWPFFDAPQRRLAADLDAWAAANVAHLDHGADIDALCREIRALRIYEGATEVQKLIIARETLKGI